MNILSISHKVNTSKVKNDNLVLYFSPDHYVSGLEKIIYEDYNRLQRDYPYNPHLNTFRKLIDLGVDIQVVPIKYKENDAPDSHLWRNRSYFCVEGEEPDEENIMFYSKARNVPVTITTSRYLDYWKWSLVSRNYSEDFYVTYEKDQSDDRIIYYEDLGDYSELIYYNEYFDRTQESHEVNQVLGGEITIEFTTDSGGDVSRTQIVNALAQSIDEYMDTEDYPDFILIDDAFTFYYDEDDEKYIDLLDDLYDGIDLRSKLLELTDNQKSQALVLVDNSSSPSSNRSSNNRAIYLTNDKVYYNGLECNCWLTYVNMLLIYGKYQDRLDDNIRYSGFGSYPDYDKLTSYKLGEKVVYKEDSYYCRVSASTKGAFDSTQWVEINSNLNGINYDTNEYYYVKGIVEYPNQTSFFIIRFFTSRLSRLILRSATYLRGGTQYTSDKFINSCISTMLTYENVNDVEVVSSELKDNRVKLEFNMYINYLTNKKINLKLNINSI